eukprot:XP_001701656.1 predicted protein [Chlamydomonas reinhardtii]
MANMRAWLHTHAMVGKVDKLHPAVEGMIEKWFELVDDDGSRTLSHSELFSALKAAKVPCDDATIKTLIGLMDVNKDGMIGWDEFEMFMTEEFVAGKSLLGGEYLLPTGVALPFGAMVDKLSRDRLMQEIMTPGASRNRWADVARDPEALSKAVSGIKMAAEVTAATAPRGAPSSQLSDGGGGAEPLTPRQALTAAMLQELEAEKAAAAGAGGIASPVPLAGAASSGGVPPQLTARNPMHANQPNGTLLRRSLSTSVSQHARSVSPGPGSPGGSAVCPAPGSGAATARTRTGLSPLPANATAAAAVAAASGSATARSPFSDSPRSSAAGGHGSRLVSQMAALFGNGSGSGSPGGGSSRANSFRRRSTGPFNADFGALAGATAAAGNDYRSSPGGRSPGGASPGGASMPLPPMPYCYTVHSAAQSSASPSNIADELCPFGGGPGDEEYYEADGPLAGGRLTPGRRDGTAPELPRAHSCSNLLPSQRSQLLLQRQQMQAQLPIVPPPLTVPRGGSACSGPASSPFESGGASNLSSPAAEARRLPPLQLPPPPGCPSSPSPSRQPAGEGDDCQGDTGRPPQRTLSLVGQMAERLAEERRAAQLQELASASASGYGTARSLASPGGAGGAMSGSFAAAAAAANSGRGSHTEPQLHFGDSEDGESGLGAPWDVGASASGSSTANMRSISSINGMGWPASGGPSGLAADVRRGTHTGQQQLPRASSDAHGSGAAGAMARASIPPLHLGSHEDAGFAAAMLQGVPTSRPTYGGNARAMPVLTDAAGMNGYMRERLLGAGGSGTQQPPAEALSPQAGLPPQLQLQHPSNKFLAAAAAAAASTAAELQADAQAASAGAAAGAGAVAAPGAAALSPQPPAPRTEPRPPLGGEASRLRLPMSALSAAAAGKASSTPAAGGAGGR